MKIHVDFVNELPEPEKFGADREVFKDSMLEQAERHALDWTRQYVDNGQTPEVWIEEDELYL